MWIKHETWPLSHFRDHFLYFLLLIYKRFIASSNERNSGERLKCLCYCDKMFEGLGLYLKFLIFIISIKSVSNVQHVWISWLLITFQSVLDSPWRFFFSIIFHNAQNAHKFDYLKIICDVPVCWKFFKWLVEKK